MAQPLPATPVPDDRSSAASFPWFVAGAGTWFGAAGMQQVLFTWLVVGELRAPPEWVGIAQSSLMLPAVFLILIGGVVADRRDRRALLIGLHLLAAALSAGLIAGVALGWLSLPFLIGYAIAMGTVGAFVMPARDSLLSEVAGPDLMRAVTWMTLAQWGSQATGTLLGGSARWIGTVPALCLHCVTLLGGAPTMSRVPAAPPRHAPVERPRWRDVGAGLVEVYRSPALLPPWLLVAAVGVMFIGPFMVVFPILIRDYYGGGVGALGLLSAMFPLGTIVGSLAILRRGGIRRKGLAQLLALCVGSCSLGIVSLGLPYPVMLFAVSTWGVGASVFMNAGRTVFQENAPESHRARVLSVYTLGFMGAAGLVGAPLSGLLVDAIGPLATCSATAAGMLAVVVLTWLLTDVARLE